MNFGVSIIMTRKPVCVLRTFTFPLNRSCYNPDSVWIE